MLGKNVLRGSIQNVRSGAKKYTK